MLQHFKFTLNDKVEYHPVTNMYSIIPDPITCAAVWYRVWLHQSTQKPHPQNSLWTDKMFKTCYYQFCPILIYWAHGTKFVGALLKFAYLGSLINR